MSILRQESFYYFFKFFAWKHFYVTWPPKSPFLAAVSESSASELCAACTTEDDSASSAPFRSCWSEDSPFWWFFSALWVPSFPECDPRRWLPVSPARLLTLCVPFPFSSLPPALHLPDSSSVISPALTWLQVLPQSTVQPRSLSSCTFTFLTPR